MPQREAAVQLGYDPSNITALADVLEAKGLVERRLEPSDRRVKTLARTSRLASMVGSHSKPVIGTQGTGRSRKRLPPGPRSAWKCR